MADPFYIMWTNTGFVYTVLQFRDQSIKDKIENLGRTIYRDDDIVDEDFRRIQSNQTELMTGNLLFS